MTDTVDAVDDGATVESDDTASERLAAARQKFSDAVDGVSRRAKDAGERVREGAGRAREAAREGYGTAREGVRQGYDRVTKDLDQLGQDVGEYVRHNPGKSIAIAAGVGFLIGLLLRGRRD